MLSLLFLPFASLIDRLLGDPKTIYHPVSCIGFLAKKVETFLYEKEIPLCLKQKGLLACFLVLLPCALLALSLVEFAHLIGGSFLAFALSALIVAFCMAPKSLSEHAFEVYAPLVQKNYEQARLALALIVGREVDKLDEEGIARAAIESVAENLVDGVLATFFWAGLGLLFFGFSGAAFFAVFHRAANVLDAMWGKKDERYFDFGMPCARLDDALNFVPARLSLPCIALASLASPYFLPKESLRIGFTYRSAHRSPNSAWPEAAFAGALNIQLGGPAFYQGKIVEHPLIGEGKQKILPQHIALSVQLMWRSCFVWLSFSTLFTLIF